MTDQNIQNTIDEILGGQVARTVTALRLETVLTRLVERTRRQTEDGVLLKLLTADDIAVSLGVTPRRVRAIARNRQARGFPVGWQVPGTSQWLFRPEEIEQLRPDEKYRRK